MSKTCSWEEDPCLISIPHSAIPNLDRSNTFLKDAVFCKLGGSRTPTIEELYTIIDKDFSKGKMICALWVSETDFLLFSLASCYTDLYSTWCNCVVTFRLRSYSCSEDKLEVALCSTEGSCKAGLQFLLGLQTRPSFHVTISSTRYRASLDLDTLVLDRSSDHILDCVLRLKERRYRSFRYNSSLVPTHSHWPHAGLKTTGVALRTVLLREETTLISNS